MIKIMDKAKIMEFKLQLLIEQKLLRKGNDKFHPWVYKSYKKV